VASVGGPQQLGGPGQWPVWPVVKTALNRVPASGAGVNMGWVHLCRVA